MAEPVVIKFYSPVNETSIGQLLKAVDLKLANGVEQLCGAASDARRTR